MRILYFFSIIDQANFSFVYIVNFYHKLSITKSNYENDITINFDNDFLLHLISNSY